jgi:hypothetical protein
VCFSLPAIDSRISFPDVVVVIDPLPAKEFRGGHFHAEH